MTRRTQRRDKDPIAQLMQEHDEALAYLKLLGESSRTFMEEGYTSKGFRNLTLALRFIEKEVTDHNRKEEEALFPVLEHYVVGPTRLLRQDHKVLRRKFLRLRAAAIRLQRNKDSFAAIKSLHDISRDVVQLFVNHIHKENQILFPLVQQFLGKDELRQIARTMLSKGRA